MTAPSEYVLGTFREGVDFIAAGSRRSIAMHSAAIHSAAMHSAAMHSAAMHSAAMHPAP
jgi:hypothetical protein